MDTGIREIITQEITPRWLSDRGIRLFIRREDLTDPLISGNKWRKLRYNMAKAQQSGQKQLLTFGGAYSNHIHAVAGAAASIGFTAIGIIRGEEHFPLNPTLRYAQNAGMHLHYVDRKAYRDKERLLKELRLRYGDFYFIPEGGTNCLALQGCAEMMDRELLSMDLVTVPVGTGGTLAGMLTAAGNHQHLLGFASLKGSFLAEEVSRLLEICGKPARCSWEMIGDYHFGGYARVDEALYAFIREFKEETSILLDPVYTGKMLYGLKDMILADRFSPGVKICAVHTGGLQGWEGFRERYGWEVP